MSDETFDSSAAPAAVGYLFQCRYALFAAMQISADSDLDVSIERLDDVAFERDGDPLALLQTKHHLARRADLTDASPDLWKTLRIWAEWVRKDSDTPFRTRFFLVTTSTAPTDSAAGCLRIDRRDERKALETLRRVAIQSKSEVTAAARLAFMELTETQQQSILGSVTVLDETINAHGLGAEMSILLRYAAPKEKIAALVERLEGWWFARVIEILTAPEIRTIRILEIESKIDELRESFRPDALPVDYRHEEPPAEIAADLDRRPFVRQLHLITLSPRRVQFAIRDFYRASEQRSRWLREDLLVDGELDKYQKLLAEEWERRFEVSRESLSDSSADCDRIACGGKLYEWVELNAEYPLRTVRERFLTIGSYHILANEIIVGWHPDFVALMRESVGGDEA